VPIRFIGSQVRVFLRASELVIFDGRVEVCRHARSVTRGSQTLLLDHYLEVLLRKPGALPGATALVQARQAGMFTATHEAFWAAARRVHGDTAGTRALIDVLLLHRHTPAADVIAGINVALSVGASSVDVVAVEARKAGELARGHRSRPAQHHRPAGPATADPPAVASLTQRRPAALPASVMCRDGLLHGLAQVVPQVPAVRHLQGLRGRGSGGFGVGAAPVAAHHLDLGVSRQPCRHRLRVAALDHLDRPPCLKIYQDRRVDVAPAQGEIIDANYAHVADRLLGGRAE
jgi:hypothetical protein